MSIYEGVICEDDVFLGPSMVLNNVTNPRSAVTRKQKYKTTFIKKVQVLGQTLLLFVEILLVVLHLLERGAVVTKDVANYALIIGNPGKQTGWMSE